MFYYIYIYPYIYISNNFYEVTVPDKAAMLKIRGYTDEELSVLGADNVFYQGVGCPHRLAKLQKGDVVLDMGCGFGLDSIVASHHVI